VAVVEFSSTWKYTDTVNVGACTCALHSCATLWLNNLSVASDCSITHDDWSTSRDRAQWSSPDLHLPIAVVVNERQERHGDHTFGQPVGPPFSLMAI
jgi:hypothetical protein